MPVGTNTLGPFLRLVLPNSSMVEQEKGQVVLNQVFSGNPHVHGIPILEFTTHSVQLGLFYLHFGGVIVGVQEHIIPTGVNQFIGAKSNFDQLGKKLRYSKGSYL